MAEQVKQQTRERFDTSIYPVVPETSREVAVRSPVALATHERHERAAHRVRPLEKGALYLGRAIFGGYFVYNGINHLLNRKMLTGYAQSKGVSNADLAVTLSGLMILAGGIGVVTGAQPKLGAALIAAFLLGVSPQMHAFWNEQEPERMNDMVNFTKNMALVGGTLLAASHSAEA